MGAPKAVRMRAKALGYGVVLALVVVSIGLQLTLPTTDASRFLTIALQAVTLVAAVYPARRAAGYDPVEVIRGAH